MNAIASLTRHFLTYLAGLGGFLFAHGVIPEGAVAQANEAGAALVDPLAVICGLLAAAAVRLGIFCLGKIFPAIAEKLATPSGGMVPLAIGMMTAAALMGALPSCSAAQLAEARSIPLRTCVLTEHGRICYSSRSGIEADVDLSSGK